VGHSVNTIPNRKSAATYVCRVAAVVSASDRIGARATKQDVGSKATASCVDTDVCEPHELERERPSKELRAETVELLDTEVPVLNKLSVTLSSVTMLSARLRLKRLSDDMLRRDLSLLEVMEGARESRLLEEMLTERRIDLPALARYESSFS